MGISSTWSELGPVSTPANVAGAGAELPDSAASAVTWRTETWQSLKLSTSCSIGCSTPKGWSFLSLIVWSDKFTILTRTCCWLRSMRQRAISKPRWCSTKCSRMAAPATWSWGRSRGTVTTISWPGWTVIVLSTDTDMRQTPTSRLVTSHGTHVSSLSRPLLEPTEMSWASNISEPKSKGSEIGATWTGQSNSRVCTRKWARATPSAGRFCCWSATTRLITGFFRAGRLSLGRL